MSQVRLSLMGSTYEEYVAGVGRVGEENLGNGG